MCDISNVVTFPWGEQLANLRRNILVLLVITILGCAVTRFWCAVTRFPVAMPRFAVI